MNIICYAPCDEAGIGYFANCSEGQWGQGVKFPSQAACYSTCMQSQKGGCGNCSPVPPCPTAAIFKTVLPKEPIISEKGLSTITVNDVSKKWIAILIGSILIIFLFMMLRK